MKAREKVKILGQQQELATLTIKSMRDQLTWAIQALQYIATDGKSAQDPEKPVLFDAQGGSLNTAKVQKPKEVALDCIDLLRAMHLGLNQQIKAKKEEFGMEDKPKKEDKIEQVKLKDGEVITFSTEFDVLHHQCCDCGLVHDVHLEWEFPADVAGGEDVKLHTKWFRREGLPTVEEIEKSGGVVVPFKKPGGES